MSFSFFCKAAAEPETSELIVDFRSDLWTSIYQNKPSPIRFYEIRGHVFLLQQKSWHIDSFAGFNSLSTGRTDLVVGHQRTLVGSDLRDQSFGLRGFYETESDQQIFASAASRSASDEPSQDSRNTWAELDLKYTLAPQKTSQWVFWVNSSKNRGYLNDRILLLPAYIYTPHPEWIFTFGLTFFKLEWARTDWGRIQYALDPTNTFLKWEDRLREKIVYEILIGANAKSYLHANRTQEDLRLFFEESYIESGYSFKLSEAVHLKLRIGYGFNRSLYEGKQAFLPTGNRSTVPSDLYGSLLLGWNF